MFFSKIHKIWEIVEKIKINVNRPLSGLKYEKMFNFNKNYRIFFVYYQKQK